MLVAQRNQELRHNLPPHFSWAHPLFEQFATRFAAPAGTESGFPCIFAHKVFAMQNMQFLLLPFVADSGDYDYPVLHRGLRTYLQEALTWDGNISTAEPLLVLFEPHPTVRETADYERVFLEAMQYLIDHDEHAWQGHMPKDPNAEFWTMCFLGVPLFINVSHPNHLNRRSRNLCDTLTFVINPRERFDKVAGNDHKGHVIRQRIRANIDIYDRIPHSQYLGHYQAGELEWPQYMLPTDNEAPPLQCPLRFK